MTSKVSNSLDRCLVSLNGGPSLRKAINGSAVMFLAIQKVARFALVMVSVLAFATQAETRANPFLEKPLVAPHIHAEKQSLFRPWVGGEVPIGTYSPSAFKRHRLGTVSLTATVQAHIDALENTVHFPSYFELINTRTGKVLGMFPVLEIKDAEWYFAGNGALYLDQGNLSLCGTRITRKFLATEKAVVEVPQALLYVGAETEVMNNTPLYESPTTNTVVATVPAGAKVTVIGMHVEPSAEATPPLLVKTSFGLTGWHRRDVAPGGASLTIYQCN